MRPFPREASEDSPNAAESAVGAFSNAAGSALAERVFARPADRG
jgi:hypothetical protein